MSPACPPEPETAPSPHVVGLGSLTFAQLVVVIGDPGRMTARRPGEPVPVWTARAVVVLATGS